MRPTYDDLLPSDVGALAGASERQLAEWYHELNAWGWPAALAPAEPFRPVGYEEWMATRPDRRDDLMQWIRNRVGVKYLLLTWQTEKMLAHVAPELHPSDAAFEEWWNAPYPGDPSITQGEKSLRHAAWWAREREELRAKRRRGQKESKA